MYLSSARIENYRNFRNELVEFNEGVNVIIGHNNAGKSNVVRALSIVLDGQKSRKLTCDDFNKNIPISDLKEDPPKVRISVNIKKGKDESPDDLPTIGNWLVKLDEDYEALLTYEFFLPEKEKSQYIKLVNEALIGDEARDREQVWHIIKRDFIRLYTYKIWGGEPKTQAVADSESLQKFDFQFLDAIRDVERDMLSGKNTLLRDVFHFFLDYDLKENMHLQEEEEQLNRIRKIKERQKEFKEKADVPISLLQSRMKEGKEQILSYAKETGASFNNAKPDFEGGFSEVELFSALNLIIKYETGIDLKIPATNNGLGYNNLIYMSLLLAKMQANSDGSYMGSNAKVFSVLAIEEPEAHLHPSMQYKFLKFLKENKNKARQVIVTTHSTQITAAVSLDEIICLHNEKGVTSVGYPGRTFPDPKNKKYVQRFLDATRSDMLFAQKVILVEGVAEQLLLSIFAEYYEKKRKLDATAGDINGITDETSKLIEDNHIAVINIGGRYFDHFLYLFDITKDNTLPKKISCITDRDHVRKAISGSKFKKCYPFEYNQDASSFEYKDHSSGLENEYQSHPNIRFFSQDVQKGSTLEYDLVTTNPSLKLLVTESISNQDEIKKMMTWYANGEKDVTEYLNLLPKGTSDKPNRKNVRIEESINNCSWDSDEEKKKAIIASRYLNSIGKGENALDLLISLSDNLEKIGTEEYKEFIVPSYIVKAIEWVCK